jgi:RHS repeat-associated protein
LGNALSNGTNRTVSYDAASRITGSSHSGSGTGNNAPANFDQSYAYDNLDRLNTVTGSSSTNNQSFQYDQNGNRTQATFGSGSYTNTIAANSNQLMATTGPTPAKSNTYDAAGNLTSDGTISYTYSDRGRMVSATNGGNTVTYTHNGIDQRVQKQGPASVVATGSNSYVYDEQGHLIGEYDANQQVIEETVYLGSLPVAVLTQMIAGTGTSQTTATSIYYVYADHINTPRVITQATDNQMVWRWDNADPFGLQPSNENPSSLGTFTYNQRFPGQVYDKETNNFYNINRDYDPQQGRYVQSDPIGLGGGSFSTFNYVNGNPVSSIDPSGLCPWCYAFYFFIAENSATIGTGVAITAEIATGVPNPVSSPATVVSQEVRAGWEVGDDIYKLTRSGAIPAWSTVRARYWKNEAEDVAQCTKDWGAKNASRMKNGQPPQRYNSAKGDLEKMELSHEPIPKRDGGTNVVPRWPQDHAAVDPYRRPGY